MIQSMTGYGKSVVQLPSKKITVEIKSLNSKNLDLNTRVPSAYREKELEIRNKIAKSLVRGKVDFNLYVEITGEETTSEVNATVVNQYIKQLKNVVDGDEIELLKMAVRMPDALKTERDEIDETEFKTILKAVDEALTNINSYRTDEGAVLEKDFMQRAENIQQLLNEVIEIDPQRMENDLNYFNENIRSKDSNGKKLGFITQEIGREINTIGSKANFAPMQQLVVQMKDELEKIKEQALNVL